MLLQTWSEILTQSFQDLWIGIIAFVPNLIVALVIFILGWVVGSVLGRLVAQLITALRVDRALESAGASEILTKAGFRLNSGAFIGGLVRWFFIIAFLVAAFDVLGLSQVNIFLQQVVLGYLPNVIVASTYFACCGSDRRCNAKDSGRVCESGRLGTRSFLGRRDQVVNLDLRIHHRIVPLGHRTSIYASALYRRSGNACPCRRSCVRSWWP